ncbi:MAG TPA: AAA family ATPase [Nitrososphaeraceae archaeon]|nr:AAA family ATPase [Nitrososphaeraceae archaeon]
MNFSTLIKTKIFSRNNSNNNYNKYHFFNNIVGYDDIKELFRRTIISSADKQIHILLCGPPASAKSLFMQHLIKLENSYFTLGSHSSKSGMIDALFEKQPRYLIVDEIDKMSPKDQTVLLSLMETGIIAETKYKRAREIQLKTSVFATANETKKLLQPLLTRFSVLHLPPYTFEEFRKITQRVLCYEEECIDIDIADFISDAVWSKMKSANIRDCIRIGHMVAATAASANKEPLKKADALWFIETFLKYNNNQHTKTIE